MRLVALRHLVETLYVNDKFAGAVPDERTILIC